VDAATLHPLSPPTYPWFFGCGYAVRFNLPKAFQRARRWHLSPAADEDWPRHLPQIGDGAAARM